MKRHPVATCLSLFVLVGGLSAAQTGRDTSGRPQAFTQRVLTTGLEGPWELSWGPDGRLWVTERTGKRVTRINPADGSKTVALTIPEVHQSVQQDGLLGLALHPELLRGTGADYVYVYLTYAVNPAPEVLRRGMIRRYTYDPQTGTLKSPVDLLTGLPVHNDHVSGRLAFGPDQKLYLSVGDQGSNFGRNYCIPNRAQQVPSASEVAERDWMKYQGKLLRVNLDGTIPADNPMIAGVRSHVFSYGHRNIQGIAFGPDGTVYTAEHGPSTDDEVNLIRAGKNYGWPNVAGYRDDRAYVYGNWSAAPSCSTLTFSAVVVPPEVPQQKESAWQHADFTPPLRTFFTVDNGYDFQARGTATIAPSGLKLYAGGANAIPGWANSLLLVALKAGTVYRMKLSADGTSIVGDAEEVFKTTNRYRDIAFAPDGRRVYLATDPEGRTTNSAGVITTALENGGSILEFSYQGQP
ncbi:MAG TPA: glucose/sorbosone family PQQ-dependent dehydrogenase [Vicinamibacterales bacterium]|nr:glucose/sorbosone family PQQ-dependent dehydrogenase [Vicinamibacterales bacterium]